MDKAKLIEMIFNIKAKDELGQYLDDEQDWQEGLDYTERMKKRLDGLIQEADAWRMRLFGELQNDYIDWLNAKKVVELILRRRGGEEYKMFVEENQKEAEKFEKAGLIVRSDKTKLGWLELW